MVISIQMQHSQGDTAQKFKRILQSSQEKEKSLEKATKKSVNLAGHFLELKRI